MFRHTNYQYIIMLHIPRDITAAFSIGWNVKIMLK